MTKYGFLGFGNLAQAIYHGLKSDKKLAFAYYSLSNENKVVRALSNTQKLADWADVIWLCVKPQNLAEALGRLKTANLKNKIIISPVAGKKIEYIKKYLGKNATVIRIMPNLAVAYKKSVTAYCVSGKKTALANEVLKNLAKLGEVVVLPEKHFDLFTAIFGSGPAFLLEILQVFKNKIGELGVSGALADKLLAMLVAGTVAYFQNNCAGNSVAKLIEKITSRGGTTEAGLVYFKAKNIDKLFSQVIVSAQKRASKIK